MSAARVGEHAGEQGRLLTAEPVRAGVEDPLGRGAGAEDAVTELGEVEIDLKDAALGPDQFDHRCHHRL